VVGVNCPIHLILEDLEAHGMTIEDLAERSGVSVSRILDVGYGRAKPTIENSIRCARAMGVEPEYLMKRIGILDIAVPQTELEIRHYWQYMSESERDGLLVALRALVAMKTADVAGHG